MKFSSYLSDAVNLVQLWNTTSFTDSAYDFSYCVSDLRGSNFGFVYCDLEIFLQIQFWVTFFTFTVFLICSNIQELHLQLQMKASMDKPVL